MRSGALLHLSWCRYSLGVQLFNWNNSAQNEIEGKDTSPLNTNLICTSHESMYKCHRTSNAACCWGGRNELWVKTVEGQHWSFFQLSQQIKKMKKTKQKDSWYRASKQLCGGDGCRASNMACCQEHGGMSYGSKQWWGWLRHFFNEVSRQNRIKKGFVVHGRSIVPLWQWLKVKSG